MNEQSQHKRCYFYLNQCLYVQLDELYLSKQQDELIEEFIAARLNGDRAILPECIVRFATFRSATYHPIIKLIYVTDSLPYESNQAIARRMRQIKADLARLWEFAYRARDNANSIMMTSQLVEEGLIDLENEINHVQAKAVDDMMNNAKPSSREPSKQVRGKSIE